MRKMALLLTAILVVSLIASSSAMATSSSRSRSGTIVQIVNFYIHTLYGHLLSIEEDLPIESIDVDGLLVGGDADDLAGGKIDRIGEELRDSKSIILEGLDNFITSTD